MPPEDGQSEVSVTTGAPVSSATGTAAEAVEQAFAALSMEELPSSRARTRTHSSPTHHTLPLEQAVPSTRAHSPPPLTQLCLSTIAEHSAGLVSIEGLAEELSIRLLREILLLGKLDFRLCRVFMDSEHEELSKAVASLNLFDALGCARPSGGYGFGSGCRR